MIEEELRRALAGLVDGLPPKQAAGAVQRLIDSYRGTTPTSAPVLRGRPDVVAYAAYRMPATFGAASAALSALAARVPHWAPGGHLDLGGGTGAAVWAAARVWGDGAAGADGAEPEEPRRTTVLDWAEPALALGRELAVAAGGAEGAAALRGVRWRRRSLRSAAPGGEADAPLPEADLVTVSYVLGELDEADRGAAVDAALGAVAGSGGAVVVIEPGTPDGYERVRTARRQLTDAGLRILAPCPHSGRCPIEPGTDWCHFSARIGRSSLHRRVKGGSLPYEDEKYAYVAAAGPALAPAAAAPSRIVRRPQLRKGQVLLDLCEAGEGLRRSTVTKRHGAAYRAARDAAWGDAWPPAGSGE